VLVDGTPQSKAGFSVSSTAVVQITAEDPKCVAHCPLALACPDARARRYVCRAGYKLEAALDRFGVDVTGLVALDAGLSTGGFTDCLLQRGAARVYGIDVGYGQARAPRRLRQNETLSRPAGC
jgi:23S rRNA (cytidine1920-2'-O)/16S rRNA (cytidine1409-2'-O)-methyltransferase